MLCAWFVTVANLDEYVTVANMRPIYDSCHYENHILTVANETNMW